MTFISTVLTLYPETFSEPLHVSLAGRVSVDTDGHCSQPGGFKLSVDTRAKDGVTWDDGAERCR